MVKENRIDPDELMASLEKEGYGKLTIFLGAAAGVGKTYAMLEAAKDKLSEGLDVVVGIVETHERADTELMRAGLPTVPTRHQEYKGKVFGEMDLDAILARCPQIVLVDELAHTNVTGSRHKKRYMDVKELLAAGINVYTTLNIQHLESLNDIIAQITGVTVRETVPDQILETASQIKLIDIPPEELIQRLKEGKDAGLSQTSNAERGKERGSGSQRRRSFSVIPYFASLLMMIVMTLIITPISAFLGIANISMLYLLPVLLSAARWGRLPAVVTATMGVITFDFFFVPPIFTFTVADLRYLLSFTIFMLVGLMTGTLSARLKEQIKYSRQRENRVSALYALSRDIAAVDKLDDVLESIVSNIAGTLEGQVVLLLPNEKGKLVLKNGFRSNSFINNSELAVASWVFDKGQKAGKGTETLGTAAALYLPLSTEQGVQGVLGICFNAQEAQNDPERLRLLEAFIGLAAMAINRIKLAEQARQTHTLIESERLRTALFNSLSHDLRTPLASIIGAVTGLIEDQNAVYSPEAQQDLLQTILHGAERMNRFVNNLLDMARLESGMLKLNKDWCDLQDIIGVAVNNLGEALTSRPLDINVQPELPLVRADFILIEQVLINLLDNALKYSEQDSKIVVSTQKRGKQVETAVANRGQGIPETDLSKVFDKFYRLNSPLQVSGTGLGLAICKGIIEAHGGEIWAENNKLGGVTITFTIPLSSKSLGRVPVMNEGV